ncbi:MAG: protoheme IX farnesyltransferase [Chloroflexi bacterium]|nr:MAG: protoheme IX farnesyltransferase [Chloroflexota bacterium]
MLDAVTATTRVARDVRATVWTYLRLTKPRIVALLVITTIPAMIMAEGGLPSLWLMLATVVGGSVVAGGANAMNMYFDRDIDGLMLRTRGRPLPAGQVEPEKAAVFGMLMGATGFVFLDLGVNLLAACLTLGAFAFYVVVYTLLLKRTTPLNIVIGGAAGAMPPVIGWAAVTNELSVAALIMFAIVTAWTPPHFWALSINYSSDYKRAGVPMLPVVSGPAETRRQIFLYSLVLVGISLLLALWGGAGTIYLAAALVLGGGFVYYAARLWLSDSAKPAAALFRYSIVYLALLFSAIALDALVR